MCFDAQPSVVLKLCLFNGFVSFDAVTVGFSIGVVDKLEASGSAPHLLLRLFHYFRCAFCDCTMIRLTDG